MWTLERPVVSLRQRGIKPQRKGARSRQRKQAASKFQSSSATATLPLNTKQLSSASTLFLVQLLHTALGCFISALILTLFTQPWILGYSVFLGKARGPCGRDPFNALGQWSGTLFLSLSGVHPYSLESKLKTHLFSSAYWCSCFLSSPSTNPSPVMHVSVVSLCVHVW